MPEIVSLISIVIAFCTLCKPCIACTTEYGSMTAEQTVEVGSRLEITCNLSSNILKIDRKDYPVNASYLTIMKTNNTSSSPVDDRNVHIISPLALSWRVNSTTDEDTGIYSCTVNAGNKNWIVCFTQAYVGRKPQRSSIDFRCTSNFEVLECRWKTEPSVLKTKSVLKDIARLRINNRITSETPCPNMISNNNTWLCRWTEVLYPPFNFRREKFEFHVETRNVFGTKSDSYFISHYEIVLPKKPRELKVLSRTPNMIELTWLRPEHLDDFLENLIYQIILLPQNQPKLKVIKNTNRSDLRISYKIADLVPNTVYDIVLRCRSPYARGEEMWSLNVTIRNQTLPDVPYLPPDIAKEAFEVIKFQHYRTIIIRWKNVPKEYWNGENFHYIVKRIRNGRKERDGLKYNITFANFDKLELDSSYHFQIFSANNNGSSKNYSSIIVDSDEKLLDVPENITVISYSHKEYNISWKPSNRHSATIKSYTLFWCDRPRSYIGHCEGSLHWKHVTETSIFLSITDEGRDFQFAVAADSEDSTSGMTWAPCIVPHNGKPSKPDLEFCYETPTSLLASLKLKCRAERALIKESYILYCRAASEDNDCGGDEIVKKLSDGAESYNITDLDPFTLYSAYFRVFTHNNESVDSDIQYQQTLSAAPVDPPSNVKALRVTNSSIEISWEAPKRPNGIITSYWLKYNEFNEIYHTNSSDSNRAVLTKKIMPFTNYTILLKACVDSKFSPPSEPLLVLTDIGIPGEMRKPQIEVNASWANIQWHPPLNPNGPIDYYLLYVKCIEGYNESYTKIINMTGDITSKVVGVDCPAIEKGIRYSFQLQPVNNFGNKHLFGEKTEPTSKVMCRLNEGLSLEMVVSIVVGSAVGCAILLIISYMFIRWMKKKYDLLKTIKVRLPKGLDTPNKYTPGTYQEFEKELLQHCPNPVQRQGSFSSDSIKNRHGSGNSQYSNYSTDELLMRRSNHCGVFCRNPSGDSSSGCSSTGGHDSIVSCCTNQTHISADSGAEIDLSPVSVKDDVFLQEESQQEPAIFILPDVKEKGCNDSKLTSEKDHELEKSPKMETNSNIARNFPSLSSAHIQPYSKFGMNQVKDGRCQNYSRQHSILPYVRNLANSEPSVAEFDFDNADDYGSCLISYSKLTFSKSLENISGNNIGYSKCGIVDNNAVCDVPNIIKLTDFNTSKHQNDTKTGNASKPYYVGIRKCLEDRSNMAKPQVPPLTENAGATVSFDSMAYSKFDINPSLDSRINTKQTAYIPLQKAMLQAMDIPCNPHNDAMDKDLSSTNISLPAEIVVSAIIDPHVEQCAINGSNYVPLGHHNNIYFCTNHVGNQDIRPVSLDYNRTDEKPIASLSDINLNKDGRLGTNENQTSADEQTSLKSNYLKESEVVVSPGSLNYSATLVPEYRFHGQSNKVEPVNSKSGYINFSPVYYV